MKKFLVVVFVFITSLVLLAGDRIQIESAGAFTIDGLRFALNHRDGSWRSKPQDRNSVHPASGFPIKQNGMFQLRGMYSTFGGQRFAFTEEITPLGSDEFRYQASFASPDNIPTKALGLFAKLNMADFAGRRITFNGKSVGFGEKLDDKNWRLTLVSQKGTLVIPLNNGTLHITGTFSLHMQDERKFNQNHWALWLLLPENREKTGFDRSLNATFRFVPYRSATLNLRAAANMGFADKTADDGKGGWTDQGPDNDLSMMTGGVRNFAGLTFDIIDPAKNGGKSCIALGGKYRKQFPITRSISVDDVTGKYLYLLHGAAWEQREGTPLGTIQLTYADGTTGEVALKSGVDISNFWNPVSRENASVVWQEANRSAQVGLYLSRFELSGKPVRSLTFQSAGNAVWMIVGATLSPDLIALPSRRPVILRPDSEWHPITGVGKVKSGSVLDFSTLLEAPAGKYGFVTIKGDRFICEKNDKELKLWGANICQEVLFADDGLLQKTADDFVRYGYNFARLHQFDHRIYRRENGRTVSLNPDTMDRLDRLAAYLKERGVYLTIDLYTRRVLAPGELPEFPNSEVRMDQFKSLVYVSDAAMQNWEEAAASLMNHVNPYTGLAWKDDPALVTICLLNEDTIYAVWNRDPVIKAIYETKFKEYCKERNLTITDADHDRYMNAFLSETHARGYARMKDFLRKLGVKAHLTSQNYWGQVSLALTRNDYDFTDTHFYWGHPEFLGKGWTLPAVVSSDYSVKRFAGSLNDTFGNRILGRPFTITEWDYVNPGAYTVEGAFVAGAYAALQGWNGMCRFTYTHAPNRIRIDDHPIFLFDMVGDPLRTLSERAGTLFFLRGDVAPAPISYPVVISPDYFKQAGNPEYYPAAVQRLGLLGKTGVMVVPAGTKPKLPSGTRGVITLEGALWDSVDFGVPHYRAGRGEQLEVATAPNDAYRSATGEILLDQPNGVFQVVTDKSEGFLIPEKQQLDGSFARVRSEKSWSAVLVAAVDNRKLTESDRLLITHLTEAKNTNMRFGNREMTLIESWGTAPQLMRRGRAELTLKRDLSNFQLFAVSFDGTRLFEVPFTVRNGESSIKLDNVRNNVSVAAYELIKKNLVQQ